MAWFHAVVTNHVVVFVLTLLGVLRELSLFFCGIVVYPAVRSSVILVGLLQFSPPLIFAVLVSLALRIKGFSACRRQVRVTDFCFCSMFRRE